MVNNDSHYNRQFRLVAVVSALLSVIPRLLFLDVPFDRDEGVYAHVASVIGQGGLPYLNVFDHKPPLIFYLYRLSFLLFGETLHAPRLLAIFFVALAAFFLFFLVYRSTNDRLASSFAVILFGVGSASPAYLGFSTNTELFSLPAIVGAIYCLAGGAPAPPKWFLSGLLFGMAFMVKQPVALIAVVVAGTNLLFWKITLRVKAWTALYFVVGFILPFGAIAGYFAAHDGLARFWRDAFSYNFGYANHLSWAEGISNLLFVMGKMVFYDPLTWVAGVSGLILVVTCRRCRMNCTDLHLFAATGLGAMLAVALGKNFFPHYFLFLLPFIGWSGGLSLSCLASAAGRRPVLAVSGIVTIIVVLQVFYFARMTHGDLLRLWHPDRLAIQSRSVGESLRSGVGGTRRLFIIGSEPEIYFYSGLTPATRTNYFFPLVMPSGMRQELRDEVLEQLSSGMPEYLVIVNKSSSLWMSNMLSDPFVVSVMKRFAEYRVVGAVFADREEYTPYLGQKSFAKNAAEGVDIILLQRPDLTENSDGPALGRMIGL